MINFIGGLPRSGSTLLSNILAQNPNFHVSPTNGISKIIVDFRDNWRKIETFNTQGLDNIYPRLKGMYKGVLFGFYENELKNGNIIFDKSRGWNGLVELLEATFEHKIKVIFPIRNINEIIISFEKIYDQNALGGGKSMNQTVYERANELLDPNGVIGSHVTYLRNLRNKGKLDKLHFVKFKDICNETNNVISNIESEFNLPKYDYHYTNLKQQTFEMDTYFGYSPNSLHRIKNEIKPYEEIDYHKYLPNDLINTINERYADINELAK